MDLFATQDNSQLPQFVSQCPDPWALGCDALRVTRVLLVLLKGPKMSLCPFERTFQKDKKDFPKDILNMHMSFKTYSSDYHSLCKYF